MHDCSVLLWKEIGQVRHMDSDSVSWFYPVPLNKLRCSVLKYSLTASSYVDYFPILSVHCSFRYGVMDRSSS